MTAKERMMKRAPYPICKWDDERQSYFIFDDDSNPCFRLGHKSAAKAWSDMEKLYDRLDYIYGGPS